jgi:glutamyl-Q tRNA(Asp) synthetase
VLKRKEGFYAYQLAVVSDDHAQGITHVVRGYDLLDSTPMQLAIYQALDLCPPAFAHFPVLCAKGQKLSKQNYAEAINDSSARDNLIAALRLLGLNDASKEQDISQMLSTAIKTWDPRTIHGIKEILSPL